MDLDRQKKKEEKDNLVDNWLVDRFIFLLLSPSTDGPGTPPPPPGTPIPKFASDVCPSRRAEFRSWSSAAILMVRVGMGATHHPLLMTDLLRVSLVPPGLRWNDRLRLLHVLIGQLARLGLVGGVPHRSEPGHASLRGKSVGAGLETDHSWKNHLSRSKINRSAFNQSFNQSIYLGTFGSGRRWTGQAPPNAAVQSRSCPSGKRTCSN